MGPSSYDVDDDNLKEQLIILGHSFIMYSASMLSSYVDQSSVLCISKGRCVYKWQLL